MSKGGRFGLHVYTETVPLHVRTEGCLVQGVDGVLLGALFLYELLTVHYSGGLQ